MTINEVLTRVKKDRPGESSDAEMIRWLSQLDQRWVDEVINTHVPQEPRDTEIRFLPAEQGETVYQGVTFTVAGRKTTINGEGAWSGAHSVWTGQVRLYAGRKYTLDMQEAGGTRDDWNSVILLHVKLGDTELPAINPAESWEDFTVEETGDYTLELTVAAGQGCGPFGNWKCRVILTGELTDAELQDYENVEGSTELLIPSPDEEIYIHWLYAQIDYRLGEIERYNIDAQMFNTRWDAAAKRYNRQHMPLGRTIRHVAYGRPVRWLGDEDPLNQRPRGW